MFDFTAMQAASLYLVILMVFGIFVAYRVIQARQGDDDELLQKRIRIHGNLIEYAPFFLIGLLALAASNAPVWLVHVLGATFTAARLAHGLNFYNKPDVTGRPKGRFLGTLFTGITTLSLAVSLLYFIFLG
ncbi:MAG: MAPEG family protein [Robiginitomaculum sp.]|nr:MAPEG family protein [Robiginitomaculum sp.]